MPVNFDSIKNLFSRNNHSSGQGEANTPVVDETEIVKAFQKKFNLEFSDPDLIKTALKHRSFLNITNEPRICSNERLEFLGDAVLDLIVAQYLYQKFPKKTEGELSKVKSILVRRSVLADIAVKISLGNLILINWGEEKTGGRNRQSILADTFEAVVGAIHLDKGIEKAAEFIHTYLLNDFKKIVKTELYKNHKSILLEYTQSIGSGMPTYKVVEETGPDHAKNFVIEVYINNERMGIGQGSTKKIAEQEAAKQAIKALNIKEFD